MELRVCITEWEGPVVLFKKCNLECKKEIVFGLCMDLSLANDICVFFIDYGIYY